MSDAEAGLFLCFLVMVHLERRGSVSCTFTAPQFPFSTTILILPLTFLPSLKVADFYT